jgi:ribosome maturation factor RimP
LNEKVKNIEEIVRQNLPDPSYFLVDVKVHGSRGNEKVVILIDGDEGVDIQTCSAVSRAVSKDLDMNDLFVGNYTLEVSSPGVDYPMKTARQFRKNMGRQVRIVLNDNKTFHGKLTGVEDLGIRIKKVDQRSKKPSSEVYVPYSEIRKSRILVTFK